MGEEKRWLIRGEPQSRWLSRSSRHQQREIVRQGGSRRPVRDGSVYCFQDCSRRFAAVLVHHRRQLHLAELFIARIQSIYAGVEHNVYYFLGAALIAIVLTSGYLIRSNRRLFDQLARLSTQRSELARKLITMQEEVLRSISRELHDEFGQILTAMGAMLGRAAKQDVPPSFRENLQEVREIAQSTLEKTRSLYQSLHPAILDDGGLEQAFAWYLPVFERQTGIKVQYQKTGTSPVVSDGVAIHVYRVLQEALNNLAKHSKSSLAWVRLEFSPERLHLEVEDRGVGLPAEQSAGLRRGIGMVAMRERAELLRGKIEFLHPAEGGTLVRLDVPLTTVGPYEQ